MARAGSVRERLRHHPLYRESVVVVFPPGHRFARQVSVRLSDLEGESFLLRTNCEKRALLLESCRRQGFQPKIVYRTQRENWIQMMVAAGRGITLMPDSLHLGHGTQARPLIEPALNREVSLVTVAGRPRAPAVRHFIRAVETHCWDLETAAIGGSECWNTHAVQPAELASGGTVLE
jgi:DNA-binding transcriptional LysR family regulator